MKVKYLTPFTLTTSVLLTEDTAHTEITQNDGQKDNFNVSVMFSVVADDSAAGACVWLLRMRRDSSGER